MTLTKEKIEELRGLERRATEGPWDAFDNYVHSDAADGERGNLVAEFFADNPMRGDNSNDTHFTAALRNNAKALPDAAEEN